MWKMVDDIIECDECGSPLGPPPQFLIPPPPRPPFLDEQNLNRCNEEELIRKAQQYWEQDMCEAIPIFDASFYSSQSLQTSAMIAVFSLLLVLVVLISSLFIWKNKRKVQNFLPCKTPTRGPHMNGNLPLGGSHSLTYEDPDAHLGHHRPLVMRHHHNVEIMHGKSIHYPSGYPMTRSPPFLVSSSPGPDPYRSLDNVYEELGPARDSDADSEPPLHSDDDFAEDELSLPGEHSFNKSTASEAASNLPGVATIYHERTTANSNAPERNSVLSTSSSSQECSTVTAASSSSSHNNNSHHQSNSNNDNNNSTTSNNSATGSTRGACGGLLSSVLRHTTGRSKLHNGARTKTHRHNTQSVDDINTSTSTADTTDMGAIQHMYDKRCNLMSLAYVPGNMPQHQQQQQQQPHAYHSLHHINNNSAHNTRLPQFYNTLESEVDRRNRINAQLSQPHAVATIFRERLQHLAQNSRYPQPYYTTQNSNNSILRGSLTTRTNPRTFERRHQIAPPHSLEPVYGYAEPLYQSNYNYDTCHAATQPRVTAQHAAYPNYITTDYANNSIYHTAHAPHAYHNSTHLYSRGDSSFGSDSGYSHHTPPSSIGRHDYDMTYTMPSANVQKPANKLTTALNFSWNRRKANTNVPVALKVEHTASMHAPSESLEATSPNNNSSSSTVTSTLENSSTYSNTNATTTTSAMLQKNNNSISEAHA
ncbi:protein kinase 4 [Teleopsis dalmanni]|uniref:protein kinase 4 n=1 Tax=Teleopsis dalmanni TaxID=139649 RepID=UPI0018CE3F0E|nr:protein kinase 4 [Teleopsis dalmanni]